MPKNKSSKTQKQVARNTTVMVRELQQPPRRLVSVTFPMVFRFTAYGTQSASTYYRNQMLSLLLLGGTSTTTNVRLIQSIRIRKLELWDPASTGSPGNHANITWLGTQTQRAVLDAATVGTSAAAYISSVPPRDSTAYFVSTQSVNEGEALFGLTASIGSILDLHATVTIVSDSTTANSFYTTSASPVQNVMYYTNLDGTAGNMRPTVELCRIT
jgi:hypothetical protein